LQSEKNAAQHRHATTNMAAAKGSDCRPGAASTASAPVSSPTSCPSGLNFRCPVQSFVAPRVRYEDRLQLFRPVCGLIKLVHESFVQVMLQLFSPDFDPVELKHWTQDIQHPVRFRRDKRPVVHHQGRRPVVMRELTGNPRRTTGSRMTRKKLLPNLLFRSSLDFAIWHRDKTRPPSFACLRV
jgi:hypothetical protein